MQLIYIFLYKDTNCKNSHTVIAEYPKGESICLRLQPTLYFHQVKQLHLVDILNYYISEYRKVSVIMLPLD